MQFTLLVQHKLVGSEAPEDMGSKSEATLRLRADKAHSELFDLHSDLRAVERRIRVLGCRNVGGKSRVVRFLLQ